MSILILGLALALCFAAFAFVGCLLEWNRPR
jgi:hypothetical protein